MYVTTNLCVLVSHEYSTYFHYTHIFKQLLKHEFIFWSLISEINTGVPADGRCLFRAIAHVACLRNGEDAPDENRQRELADDLRAQVIFCSFLTIQNFKFHLPFVWLSFCASQRFWICRLVSWKGLNRMISLFFHSSNFTVNRFYLSRKEQKLFDFGTF